MPFSEIPRRSWVIGLGLLAIGCEPEVGKCGQGAGDECLDPAAELDGGMGVDAGRREAGSSTQPSSLRDASRADAARSDARVAGDSGPSVLTMEQFCHAQLAVAVAWRDLFESEACGCAADDEEEQTVRSNFLASVLGYAGADPEASCIFSRELWSSDNHIAFHPERAAGCVQSFISQFAPPPSGCPVDVAHYESLIAHGAQTLVQLPECRAAMIGTVAAGHECTDPQFQGDRGLDCMPGLRCQIGLGGVRPTCQPAQDVDQRCQRTSDCGDGLICSGLPGRAALTCVPSTALRASAERCRSSPECQANYVCDDNIDGKCVPPVPKLICGD